MPSFPDARQGAMLRRMAALSKKSISLSGHATSLALEPEFWAVLHAMALADNLSLAALIRRLDETRGPRALASACRVAALAWAGGERIESEI